MNRYIKAVPVSTPIDNDAKAFLTATGLTGDNEILAVNTFVTLAKSNGIWTDLDKIYPFIGGTETTHMYNLKNALHEGLFYGGVTHTDNGVTFDGVSGYFDTGWSTSADNLYNRHFSQYVAQSLTNGAWSGSFDGTNAFGMRLDSGRHLSYCGFNSLESTTLLDIDRHSVTCVTIDSSTVGKIYNNGQLIKTNSTSINATPTTNTVYLGGLNQNGVATFLQNSSVRFCTTGASLDASKQEFLNSLVRHFNAILSR